MIEVEGDGDGKSAGDFAVAEEWIGVALDGDLSADGVSIVQLDDDDDARLLLFGIVAFKSNQVEMMGVTGSEHRVWCIKLHLTPYKHAPVK